MPVQLRGTLPQGSQSNLGGIINYLEILKPGGMRIGDVWCETGDVVRVMPMGEVPVDETGTPAIFPVVAALDYRRAQSLLEMRSSKGAPIVQIHPGPATVRSVAVENTALTHVVKRGEQAVAARQQPSTEGTTGGKAVPRGEKKGAI